MLQISLCLLYIYMEAIMWPDWIRKGEGNTALGCYANVSAPPWTWPLTCLSQGVISKYVTSRNLTSNSWNVCCLHSKWKICKGRDPTTLADLIAAGVTRAAQAELRDPLKQQSWEFINLCYFMSVSFRVACYIENWYRCPNFFLEYNGQNANSFSPGSIWHMLKRIARLKDSPCQEVNHISKRTYFLRTYN
jgi:hypothetical protein